MKQGLSLCMGIGLRMVESTIRRRKQHYFEKFVKSLGSGFQDVMLGVVACIVMLSFLF